MEVKQTKNQTIYLRLAKGESLLPTIQQVCQQLNVTGGYFTGIGACNAATIATYLPDKQDFIDHEFTGMLELVSLTGNISLDHDQQPYLHAHASFSYLDAAQKVVLTGGHLKGRHHWVYWRNCDYASWICDSTSI